MQWTPTEPHAVGFYLVRYSDSDRLVIDVAFAKYNFPPSDVPRLPELIAIGGKPSWVHKVEFLGPLDLNKIAALLTGTCTIEFRADDEQGLQQLRLLLDRLQRGWKVKLQVAGLEVGQGPSTTITAKHLERTSFHGDEFTVRIL
jgi:hypothetical protein